MSDSQGIARRSTRTVKPTFKMKELGLLSTALDPDEDHLKTAGSRNGLKKNSRTEFRNHNKELLQNDTRNQLTLDDEKVCGSLNVGRKSNRPNNIAVARNVPIKRLQLKNANITDGTGNVVHVIDPKAKKLVKTAEIEGSSISTTKTVCETANSGIAITSLDDSCIVETDKMIENVDKKRCSIGLGRHNKIQQAHDVADEKDDAESKCDDLTEQTIKVLSTPVEFPLSLQIDDSDGSQLKILNGMFFVSKSCIDGWCFLRNVQCLNNIKGYVLMDCMNCIQCIL
ncbi:hypothetical protein DPMN_158761 [Dreissena polymorpha]|uniref:Uncharacterized protein n=1 Tax=Dreissena polymorpha TaxID=45954 RepID=A0A9D4IM98_DREPO|nr:hypothetical protein DPMN_158761 [Dreissena polymorpha]